MQYQIDKEQVRAVMEARAIKTQAELAGKISCRCFYPKRAIQSKAAIKKCLMYWRLTRER